MKRSEFIREGCAWSPPGCEAWVTRLADLAEEAGVTWDPEESELPERVFVDGDRLAAVGSRWMESSVDDLLLDEAAARYNAVSRFLVDHPAAPTLHRILAQEREKLRRSHE